MGIGLLKSWRRVFAWILFLRVDETWGTALETDMAVDLEHFNHPFWEVIYSLTHVSIKLSSSVDLAFYDQYYSNKSEG